MLKRFVSWSFVAVVFLPLLAAEGPAFAQGQDSQSGARLTTSELETLLVGRTEVGYYPWKGQWIKYRESFHPSGTINGDDGSPYNGSYKIHDDMICAEYSGGDKGCYAYVNAGDGRYTVYEAKDGGVLGDVKAKNVRVSE